MLSNYENSRLASTEARINGYDAGIILNPQGKVAEGSYACIFIVRDWVAITPGVTSGILESITRDTVMRLFTETLGVPVVERDMDRTELYVADESFSALVRRDRACGVRRPVRGGIWKARPADQKDPGVSTGTWCAGRTSRCPTGSYRCGTGIAQGSKTAFRPPLTGDRIGKTERCLT